jgi:C4-dicarboxylate-binding protein DctP
MLAPSLAKFSGLGAPQFEVFDLPFLFNSMSDVHRITEGPVGASLMTKLEPHGVKGLAYWDNGFKSFSAKTPIKTPEDLKGRKLRIQASKVLDAQMKALGAIPVPLAFSAVYDSLQSGATEGTENPISNFYTKKFREVQKYLTLTEHGYLGYAVIANKKFWDGLPSEIRRELSQAMKETTVYANKIAQQDNDGMVQAERLTRHIAIYEPSEAERQAFRKALWPVHAKMSERIGADIIQQFYKELGTVPPQP